MEQTVQPGGPQDDDRELFEPIPAHVEAALVPTDAPYPPPLDQLLHLGEPGSLFGAHPRLDELDVDQIYVPDLVRMTRDRELNWADSDGDEVWAPYHALCLLERLDIGEVVPDLIPLFDTGDDWVREEMARVLANAGPAALEPLRIYLQDRTRWLFGRAMVGETLAQLGVKHPHLRDQALQILEEQLRQFGNNGDEFNGFLVSNLLTLQAVEALPTIRQAFEQDIVDESIVGGWPEVLDALGQTPDPDDPLVARYASHAGPPRDPEARLRAREADRRAKRKRKAEKAARKANRPKHKKTRR